MQEQFTKRGYDLSLIETNINKIKLLRRKGLLIPKIIQEAQVLPPTVPYNRTPHNISLIYL